MTSGKKRGKGADWGRWEHGSAASWLGRRRGWLDDHCYRMYCVGADQETAKGGGRGAHLHPQSGDANEEPGRVVLDSRTVTPVQSLPHLLLRLRQPAQSGWRRPPRAVGCASRNEVPLCCRRPVELRQGDCWDSSPLPGGKHFPLSHFPGEPVDPDRPPATGSSHLSASAKQIHQARAARQLSDHSLQAVGYLPRRVHASALPRGV